MSTAIEDVMAALRSQRNVIDTAIASLRVAFALEDTPSFVPPQFEGIVDFGAPIYPGNVVLRIEPPTIPAPLPKADRKETPATNGPQPKAPAADFNGLRRTSGIQDTATLRTMITSALKRIGRPAAVSEITAACRLTSGEKVYPSAVDRILDGMLTDDAVRLADKQNYGPGDVEQWVLVDPDYVPTPKALRSQAQLRIDVTRLCRRGPMTSGQIINALPEYGKGSIYSCLTTMRKAGEIETKRLAEGDKNCWIGGAE